MSQYSNEEYDIVEYLEEITEEWDEETGKWVETKVIEKAIPKKHHTTDKTGWKKGKDGWATQEGS